MSHAENDVGVRSTDCLMTSAASFTSNRVRLSLPTIIEQHALPPSTETSRRGLARLPWPHQPPWSLPEPLPIDIQAGPASFMIAFTSAKSRLIRPGTVITSEIALPRVFQHIVGESEGILDARRCVAQGEKPVVRDDNQGIDFAEKPYDTLFATSYGGRLRIRTALVTMAMVRARSAWHLSDDRG